MASKSAFVSKFHKEYESLTKAIQGDIDLEVQHPRLYQKLIRFYEDRGVQLYDDPEDDYNVILDSVEADLTNITSSMMYSHTGSGVDD